LNLYYWRETKSYSVDGPKKGLIHIDLKPSRGTGKTLSLLYCLDGAYAEIDWKGDERDSLNS
jgi:hypothetical protein